MVDAALAARQKLYKKRGGDKRKLPRAVSTSSASAEEAAPKRARKGPGVTGSVSQRTSSRVVATSVVSAPTVQGESAAAPSSARGRATSQAGGTSSSSAAGRAEPQPGGPPELVDLVEVAAVALQRVADYLRMQGRLDN